MHLDEHRAVGRRAAIAAVVFLLLFAFSYSTKTAALDLHAMLSGSSSQPSRCG